MQDAAIYNKKILWSHPIQFSQPSFFLAAGDLEKWSVPCVHQHLLTLRSHSPEPRATHSDMPCINLNSPRRHTLLKVECFSWYAPADACSRAVFASRSFGASERGTRQDIETQFQPRLRCTTAVARNHPGLNLLLSSKVKLDRIICNTLVCIELEKLFVLNPLEISVLSLTSPGPRA